MINKDVMKRIDELIMDDGYTAYEKLDIEHKHELTALSMRAMGRDAYEVLIECNDPQENVNDLIHHLLNGTNDSAWRLANTLTDNAMSYCEKALEETFDNRVDELACERKREAGLHPITDHVNGETRWIR